MKLFENTVKMSSLNIYIITQKEGKHGNQWHHKYTAINTFIYTEQVVGTLYKCAQIDIWS